MLTPSLFALPCCLIIIYFNHQNSIYRHRWITNDTSSFCPPEPLKKKKWRVAAATLRRKALLSTAEGVEPLAAIADPLVTIASLMVLFLFLSLSLQFNSFLNFHFFLLLSQLSFRLFIGFGALLVFPVNLLRFLTVSFPQLKSLVWLIGTKNLLRKTMAFSFFFFNLNVIASIKFALHS